MRKLLLSLLVIAACDNLATPPSLELSFAVVSGDGQTGIVGQPLPSPVVIKATDSKGKALRNVLVEFRVTSGGGSANPSTVTTNNQGIAQTSWTLGTSTAVSQRLETRLVSSNALLGSFTATALPGPPRSMVISSADSQTTTRLTAVPIPPAVRIADQYDNPVPGVSVTFAIPFYDEGGTLTGNPALSNGAGIATLGSWVVGSAVGRHWVQARIPELDYVVVTFTAVGTLENGARMTLQAGNNQVAQVGSFVPIHPAVRITDASSAPIAGVQPRWQTVQGEGSFINSLATDANGVSTLGNWRLCCTRGTFRLRVTLEGSPDTVFVSATGTAASPNAIAVQAGNGQSARTNAAVAVAPAAVVRDTFGNPVPRVTVDFVVTAGGGSVAGTPAVSDTNGIATVGSWTLGSEGGANTLTATTNGVSDAATFTATGVVPVVAGTKSSIAAPLGLVASAGEITATITVTARDTNSNPVPGATVTITATGTGNTVTQPTTVTDANGVTTGALSSTVEGFKTVRATINGSITLAHRIEVLGGPPASMVAYSGDNQIASAGTPVPLALQVQVRDQFGNSAYGTAVTWTVTSGGGSVTTTDTPGVINTIATSGTWTLGPVPGLNTLQATVQGTELAVTFTATGDPSFWTSHAALPTRRFVLGAGAVNGLVYAVGGLDFDNMATVEAYDPATNTWTTKAPMPTPRGELGVAAVNDVLYAIGGVNNRSVVGTVEAYDPVTDSWTTKSPMPTPRSDFGIAVVNGIIYTIGGGGCATPTFGACTTVEAYDPATDTWTTKASMPTPRYILAAAEVSGVIYAVGGRNDASFWMATVEAYDPASDTWSTRASMPTPRFGLGVAAIAGQVYALGGYTSVDNYATLTPNLEMYDPATNRWTAKPAMLEARVYMGTAVLQGVLYVVGGDGSDSHFVEAYHP